ncbi:ankyrin repeat domain-containing protein [Thaumasiovibrio subtropicus]|uniref:ankyrin repeat domain-containing protein n=1 Tax=Thaumasiovibrio subtropicus TaxID=1891207 RepID=UPI000B35BB77|nr:ankyrin repeat domain-containing protein [Thaumasiovibrio subtropicus]
MKKRIFWSATALCIAALSGPSSLAQNSPHAAPAWQYVEAFSVEPLAIESALDHIIKSNGTSPSFDDLMSISNQVTESHIKDTYFVLALFSAAVSQQESKAIAALAHYQPEATYMDNLSELHIEELVLSASYSWLVNNRVFTVPTSMMRTMPSLIAESTPTWGSNRDGYFNIATPEDWQGFNSDTYQTWRTLLDDIESPAKDLYHGSIRQARFKQERIYHALLTMAPEHLKREYATHFEAQADLPVSQSRLDWMSLWQYHGAYEFHKVEAYRKAKTALVQSLTPQLAQIHNIASNEARTLADTFIHLMESRFIFHPRHEIQYNAMVDLIEARGWVGVVNTPDVFDEYQRIEQLKFLGGYLLINAYQASEVDIPSPMAIATAVQTSTEPTSSAAASTQPDTQMAQSTLPPVPYHYDVKAYLKWLTNNHADIAAQEIINMAVTLGGSEYQLIDELKTLPSQWGTFNKTPLMYAAQYNHLPAVEYLVTHYPQLATATTTANNLLEEDTIYQYYAWGYEPPKIANRSVITYGFENGSLDMIEWLQQHVPPTVQSQSDSAGRSAKDYLQLNDRLSDAQRDSIIFPTTPASHKVQ